MSSEYRDFKHDKILDYATEKHKGQTRKYTGESYITHPISVAKIISEICSYIQPMDLDIIYRLEELAYLHDTVEDTDATLEEMESLFGEYYSKNVEYLTNISKPEDGNRKIRKMIDMEHTLKGSIDSIIVKLADIIDNCHDIVERDSSFAKKYLGEKEEFIKRAKELFQDDSSIMFKIYKQMILKAEETIYQQIKILGE